MGPDYESPQRLELEPGCEWAFIYFFPCVCVCVCVCVRARFNLQGMHTVTRQTSQHLEFESECAQAFNCFLLFVCLPSGNGHSDQTDITAPGV